ncbi:Gfo/Idh/MocA family protein [Loktanella sp. Alg231-35]|uniref:Gfo/Idh/MocA family protein n=1 Tax=Loktanella sp. Alg231-35 TaxID=1922220 RepID=UPI000D55AB91|nr:Gfo/Idh/MocA family oxidoreductase [Loktanella sp. Alg231-35]
MVVPHTPSIAIIGTGYVADFYMKSIALYPDLNIVGAYDLDAARLATFCNYWKLPAFGSAEELLAALPADGLVLNLTNPDAHFDVSRACLLAERHVYSEKPLAMEMAQAMELADLATGLGLHLGAAPCSYLSQSAQTLWAAVRSAKPGKIRLAYAEIDDGYIRQAPYKHWKSETGAPWPAEDEFQVGCTMEHAGYYLTWLIQMFGPVRTVVAASAQLTGDDPAAHDLSIGTLFHTSGVVTRLTCSIIAPHNHEIRIVGDRGVLELDECWDNLASVQFRKRMRIRRRLLELPLTRKMRLPGKDLHPVPAKGGAATMNFFLGPDQMLHDIAAGTDPTPAMQMALHVNEVTLALQNAGEHSGSQTMQSTCEPPAPQPWAQSLKGGK